MGDLFSKISSTAYTLTEEKCKNFVTEMVKVSIWFLSQAAPHLPLSQGLHYIHDHRIIHLDMKPANVMLRSTSDEFKVIHLAGDDVMCSSLLMTKLSDSFLVEADWLWAG